MRIASLFCMSLLAFCAITVLSGNSIKQKVLIMTPAYNRPEYIAMQCRAFKKCFSDEPYEFIVFNDAQEEDDVKAIADMCLSLEIPCLRVPQENRAIGKAFSWATYRHAQAIEYMMETVGFHHDGIVVLIDSDLFPIKKFNINAFLKGYQIAGLRQGRHNSDTEYLWPGLIFFRMNELPNKKSMRFLPVEKKGLTLDSGGSLYQYFQKNPKVKRLFFKQKARILLDKDLHPYLRFACPAIHQYLTCKSCKPKKNEPANNKCTHKEAIFENLGLSYETIKLIESKKVPAHTEFLLGDTFFHAVGSSGYHKYKHDRSLKYMLVMDFLNIVLGS